MIDFDEKSKDIEYKKWKEKNGEFVERLTKEIFDKYATEVIEKSVKNYFNKLSPQTLSDILYSGLYNEIQDIVKNMMCYYGSNGYAKSSQLYGVKINY